MSSRNAGRLTALESRAGLLESKVFEFESDEDEDDPAPADADVAGKKKDPGMQPAAAVLPSLPSGVVHATNDRDPFVKV